MSLPEISVTIKQNSLGLQDPAAGDALAIIGPAASGPSGNNIPSGAYNTPLLYGRGEAVQADFEAGALVEAGAMGVEVTGRPVVLVRCQTTTVGAVGDIDLAAVTGTAVPVATPGAEPLDDLEAEVSIVDGGTVGTDGITYQWSLDAGAGRTFSPKTALGTGTVITLENGVSFTLDPPADEVTIFIALVVEIRSDTLAHLADVTAHDAADTSSAQVALAASSAPTTGAEAWAVLNLARAAHEAHRVNITAHNSADSTNVLTHAAATNISSGVDLAVQYKAKFNAHLANATVHNSADVTHVLTSASPAQGTLAAGDKWTARTTMPRPSSAQLDAALAALQASSYTYKSILILPPVLSTAAANAIGTRFNTMLGAYKYKKLFTAFRRRDIGESEATYLADFKAKFDAVTCFGLLISADAEEHQSSAARPRIYARPPSWLAAAQHVALGPDVSIAFVNDGAGALPLACTIKDTNGNPKYHDEYLDPGLDAARALSLRSWPGYPGKAFFTRARTMAQLGTDFMFLHFWAVMIEVLDVAVPKLIGLVQAKGAPNPDTGRIAEDAAKDIELTVEHEIDAKVTAKSYIVRARVVLDRTVNVFSSPQLPVTISVMPYSYNDGFKLTVALQNPMFSNA